MPRKALPRLRTVAIKGKEFHQVSIPQPGGEGDSGHFKGADDAKKFYAAVQDDTSRLALYRLQERYRHCLWRQRRRRQRTPL